MPLWHSLCSHVCVYDSHMCVCVCVQANAPQVLGTDEALLTEFLTLPSGLDSWANVGILLGCAGVVTAARLQLLNVWPEFR